MDIQEIIQKQKEWNNFQLKRMKKQEELNNKITKLIEKIIELEGTNES